LSPFLTILHLEHIGEQASKPAGARDGAGRFPDGSINARVEARLASFAERSRSFLSKPAAL